MRALKLNLILSILVVAGLTACGGARTEKPASQSPAPPDQQVLRMRVAGEPRTLDPALMNASMDNSLIHQMFVGLFTYDNSSNLTTALAGQMPTVANGGISRDGLTYTIKLRGDAKWSDGTAVTANDFVYSMQRLLDPRTPAPFANFYYSINGSRELNGALGSKAEPKTPSSAELDAFRSQLGVTAQDASTVVYKLRQPDPSFLYRLSVPPAFPVRRDVIEKYGDTWTEPQNIVVDGPFTLGEWAHNQRIVFRPNPLWSGSKVILTRVEVNFIADDAVAYGAYLAGNLDVVGVPPSVVREVSNPASPLNGQLQRSSDLATFALYMNERVAPFDNQKVREAFAQAIDRDGLVEGVLQGVGKPTLSWVPRGQPGYNGDLGKNLSFNPAKAKQALAEAGFPDGKGLPKVTFVRDSTDTNRLIGQFVADQLKRNLGVEIATEYVDPKAYSSLLAIDQYQLTYSSWTGGWPYPDNWLTDLFASDSKNNHNGFKNAKFDDLIRQATNDPDEKKRLAYYDEAQKVMLDAAALIPLYNRESLILVKPNVKSLVVTPLDGAMKGDISLLGAFLVGD